MNFNFKKVFLTGSSGWLGKQLLVSLLNQQSKWVNFEHKVQIYCLLDNEISKEDKELFNAVNVVYGDIRVKEDCNQFLKCGGCDFRHVNNNWIQSWKINQLKQKTKLLVNPNKIFPIAVSDNHSRRRATFSATYFNKEFLLGFKSKFQKILFK